MRDVCPPSPPPPSAVAAAADVLAGVDVFAVIADVTSAVADGRGACVVDEIAGVVAVASGGADVVAGVMVW